MADALIDVTRGLTTTDYSEILPIYYRKSILESIFKAFGLWSKIEVEAFPQRSGTTGTLFRYANMTPTTEAASGEITEAENPSPTAVVTAKHTCTMKILGGWIVPSELAQLTTIDGLRKLPELVRDWAESSLELYLQKNLVPYLPAIRPDRDHLYFPHADIVTVGANPTYEFEINDLTGIGDGALDGAAAVCISPDSANYGISKLVSAFDDTGGTLDDMLSTAAFPYDMAAGDVLAICGASDGGFTAADCPMNITALREAAKQLRRNGIYGPRFEVKGGGYWMVMHADQEGDLTGDAAMTLLYQNKEKESGLRTYKPGVVYMMHPVLTYYPFRSANTMDATYDSNGDVMHATIFGKNCLKRLPLQNSDLEIIYKSKKNTGANPLELYSTLGWKIHMAVDGVDFGAGRCILTHADSAV